MHGESVGLVFRKCLLIVLLKQSLLINCLLTVLLEWSSNEILIDSVQHLVQSEKK